MPLIKMFGVIAIFELKKQMEDGKSNNSLQVELEDSTQVKL
jgi:hypothetical protein